MSNTEQTTEKQGPVIKDNWENKKQYIIGLDPGQTTGVAILSFDKYETRVVALGQIEGGRFTFYDAFKGTEFGTHVDQFVVSELWVERHRPDADREPQYIEGVEWALWQDETYWQPASMKSLVSDDWIKSQGLWTPGKRHQMDALIHAIVWLRNQEHMPTIMALMDEAQIGNDSGEGENENGEQSGDQDGGDQEGGDGGEGQQNGSGSGDEGEDGEQGGQDGGQQSRQFGNAMARIASRSAEEGEMWKGMTDYIVKDTARKERDLNGAFVGFHENDTELGGNQTTLFEGKF